MTINKPQILLKLSVGGLLQRIRCCVYIVRFHACSLRSHIIISLHKGLRGRKKKKKEKDQSKRCYLYSTRSLVDCEISCDHKSTDLLEGFPIPLIFFVFFCRTIKCWNEWGQARTIKCWNEWGQARLLSAGMNGGKLELLSAGMNGGKLVLIPLHDKV